MMIFKTAIPRRTFLRGLGTTLALPLLDGMVPAFAGGRQAAVSSPTRLSIVYMANGRIMDHWTPSAEGAGFEFSPTLAPLAPFRDHVLVMTGLNDEPARALLGEDTGDHGRAGATYLTGVHPKKTEGADLRAGLSMDQIAARELGKHTQLASLELCLDASDLLGQCEAGYSCAYMNTICWRTPTTPVAMENRPRLVFERLFGDTDSTDPAVRLRQIKQDRSILDSVVESTKRLVTGLTTSDRVRLTEYLDSLRDIERRIQAAEEQSSRELPAFERPADVPETFAAHAKLMFDLQVLAFQTDMTRVITFMLGREFGSRNYREIGIPEGHHTVTHHQNKQVQIDKVIKIDLFQEQMFAYYIDRLKSTPDGDGTLLDHMAVLHGGGISNGNEHLHNNLPTLLVGGANGRIKGGRHVRFPETTPITNLHLTLLDMIGVPCDTLGDSNGQLDLLAV